MMEDYYQDWIEGAGSTMYSREAHGGETIDEPWVTMWTESKYGQSERCPVYSKNKTKEGDGDYKR